MSGDDGGMRDQSMVWENLGQGRQGSIEDGWTDGRTYAGFGHDLGVRWEAWWTRTDGHMEWVNERKGGLWLLIWLGTTTIVFDIADQIPFPRHGGDLFWIVSLDSLGQKLNSHPFYPTTIVRHFGVHVVHTHTWHT